jgi:hypothetical protein
MGTVWMEQSNWVFECAAERLRFVTDLVALRLPAAFNSGLAMDPKYDMQNDTDMASAQQPLTCLEGEASPVSGVPATPCACGGVRASCEEPESVAACAQLCILTESPALGQPHLGSSEMGSLAGEERAVEQGERVLPGKTGALHGGPPQFGDCAKLACKTGPVFGDRHKSRGHKGANEMQEVQAGYRVALENKKEDKPLAAGQEKEACAEDSRVGCRNVNKQNGRVHCLSDRKFWNGGLLEVVDLCGRCLEWERDACCGTHQNSEKGPILEDVDLYQQAVKGCEGEAQGHELLDDGKGICSQSGEGMADDAALETGDLMDATSMLKGQACVTSGKYDGVHKQAERVLMGLSTRAFQGSGDTSNVKGVTHDLMSRERDFSACGGNGSRLALTADLVQGNHTLADKSRVCSVTGGDTRGGAFTKKSVHASGPAVDRSTVPSGDWISALSEPLKKSTACQTAAGREMDLKRIASVEGFVPLFHHEFGVLRDERDMLVRRLCALQTLAAQQVRAVALVCGHHTVHVRPHQVARELEGCVFPYSFKLVFE